MGKNKAKTKTKSILDHTGPRPQQALTDFVFLVFKAKLESTFSENHYFHDLFIKSLALFSMHLSISFFKVLNVGNRERENIKKTPFLLF